MKKALMKWSQQPGEWWKWREEDDNDVTNRHEINDDQLMKVDNNNGGRQISKGKLNEGVKWPCEKNPYIEADNTMKWRKMTDNVRKRKRKICH